MTEANRKGNRPGALSSRAKWDQSLKTECDPNTVRAVCGKSNVMEQDKDKPEPGKSLQFVGLSKLY